MESSDVPNAQPELFGITVDGTNSYMYEELWKLCAGSLCDLPKIGEKVYYFLQGHIELVEACTKSEELDHTQPLSTISSKLPCRVFNIQLKAEKDTNEVYAEITLMPDTLVPNTTEFIIPTSSGHHQQRPNIRYFTKVLTPSDISTHGGLLIPKKHADNFPPLNNGEHIPSQDLLVKDIHDQTWNFKHNFTGKPQRHILTTGWNAFTTAKRLVVGDGLIFLRGETGELLVGIKRTGHQQNNIPLSLISIQTIRDGVIAYAKQAFDNQCLFTVVYKPRSSQFVVSYEKYVNAMNNKFNVGSKFLMRFEGADNSVTRCSGTVIGINNFSPHWKESEWRSLQVQWDDLASFSRPDKVSPWEIEHLLPSTNVPESTLLKNKRSRLVNEIGSSSTNFWIPTLIEGQEFGQPSTSSSMNVHKLNFCDATKDSQSASDWLMSYPIPAMSEAKSTNDQMSLPINEKITTDPTISCRLFGFDLTTPSKTKCLIEPIDSYQKSGIPKYSEEKNADKTETQESPKEINNKHFKSTRSCTKVQVQGLTTEKAVDLSAFDGYNHLIHELEKIFDFKDELQTRNQWEIVFTDDEGDLMLVGDDPWPEFCDIVKKIFICSKEEVKKLKSTNLSI